MRLRVRIKHPAGRWRHCRQGFSASHRYTVLHLPKPHASLMHRKLQTQDQSKDHNFRLIFGPYEFLSRSHPSVRRLASQSNRPLCAKTIVQVTSRQRRFCTEPGLSSWSITAFSECPVTGAASKQVSDREARVTRGGIRLGNGRLQRNAAFSGSSGNDSPLRHVLARW